MLGGKSVAKARTKQEKHIDRRIKEELTRYYEYSDDICRLEVRKKRCLSAYEYEMDNPPFGGSIVKMPEGSNEKDPIVMKWEKILADIDRDIKRIEAQVHKINNWLSVLTPDQYRVIIKYVCEYQCRNRSHAAAILQCSEGNVKDRMNDGIKRIRQNFDNIL